MELTDSLVSLCFLVYSKCKHITVYIKEALSLSKYNLVLLNFYGPMKHTHGDTHTHMEIQVKILRLVIQQAGREKKLIKRES